MAESPADLFASIPSSSRSKLDSMIEDDIHLENIGECFTNWEAVAPYLGLSAGVQEEIDVNNRTAGRKRVAALRKWREKNGSNATYRSLAIAFNNAERNDLVEVVCKLLGGSHTAATKKELKADENVLLPPVLKRSCLPTMDDEPPLVEDDLFDVLTELMPVAGKWKAIGRGLRLTPGQLDTIKAAHNGDPTECLSASLTDWLRKSYDCSRHGEPSWKKVVEVVAHPAAGNNVELARRIAAKYNVKFMPMQAQQSKPASATVVVERRNSSNGSAPSLNSPIFDKRPTLLDLQVLHWNDNGEEKQIRALDIIAPRWRDLGISLQFEEHELETVDQTCLKENGRCVQKLFGLWFQRGRGYNWKVLINALEGAKFGKLAGDLKIALPLKI